MHMEFSRQMFQHVIDHGVQIVGRLPIPLLPELFHHLGDGALPC